MKQGFGNYPAGAALAAEAALERAASRTPIFPGPVGVAVATSTKPPVQIVYFPVTNLRNSSVNSDSKWIL